MKLDILIRQSLAAFGAYFAINTTSTPVFIASLLTIAFSALWSWLKKANLFNDHATLDDSYRVLLLKALGSVVSQGVAALSGILAARGFTGDVNDLGAVVLFGINIAASHGGVHQKLVRAPLHVLALCSLLSALCSCSNTSQEALKQRIESALVNAGREMSAVALQGTLDTLRAELAALEAKPIDADPMQQLLDSSRVQTIRAAIQLGEERLAKLRRAKAVTEVNEVGGRSRFQVSSFKAGQSINPLRGSSSGTTQSRPHPARAVKVMVSAPPLDAEGRQAGLPQGRVTIPHLAPQVIAALKAR